MNRRSNLRIYITSIFTYSTIRTQHWYFYNTILERKEKIHLFCALLYVRIPPMSVNIYFICCPEHWSYQKGVILRNIFPTLLFIKYRHILMHGWTKCLTIHIIIIIISNNIFTITRYLSFSQLLWGKLSSWMWRRVI